MCVVAGHSCPHIAIAPSVRHAPSHLTARQLSCPPIRWTLSQPCTPQYRCLNRVRNLGEDLSCCAEPLVSANGYRANRGTGPTYGVIAGAPYLILECRCDERVCPISLLLRVPPHPCLCPRLGGCETTNVRGKADLGTGRGGGI